MVGLRRLLLLLLLVTGVARPEEWLCKRDIAVLPTSPAPTDVAVDARGRIYVLYSGDGFLDIYDDQGNLIQHRGGNTEEKKHDARSVLPVSLWVGRLATSALLVMDPEQKISQQVLVPLEGELRSVTLRKAPQSLRGVCALARDLEGYFYVWNADGIYVFGSGGMFEEKVTLPPLARPVQLAVNSQGNFYCLDATGIHVFSCKGEPRFDVDGAQVMYLTGGDRLAAAGPDWLRRYSPEGRVEVEVKEPSFMSGLTPAAVSLNDKGGFFFYLRNADRGDGVVLKLDSRAQVVQEFEQPIRFGGVPDAGWRLDYEGRVHYWNPKESKLVKAHPGGKIERNLGYMPGSDPQGRMLHPSEIVVDKEGTAWIADSGNSRLQRFALDRGGWQKPVLIGIQGGAARATPRSLAITPSGTLLVVVHPPSPGEGGVVLQTRNLKGELISQRDVGSDRGLPVVKVAVTTQGDLYVYRSRTGVRGFEENPSLERYDARGNKAAALGADGRNLHYPGEMNRRIVLQPQEDIVAWGDGLLIATQGGFVKISPDLEATAIFKLKHPRGAKGGRVPPEFGGSALFKNVLWVTDQSNNCVHRVPIPRS